MIDLARPGIKSLLDKQQSAMGKLKAKFR